LNGDADVRLLMLTPAEYTLDVRARRAAAVARARGYDVAAACGRISGESPAPLEGIRVERTGRPRRAHRLWVAGARPGRHRSYAGRELRGLLRLGRLLLRTAGLVRAGGRLGPADVVHAHDLGTLPAGFLLGRTWNARLVYDAHELYSEFEASPPRLTRRLTLALERRLATSADAVVTVSDGMARELEARLRLPRTPLVVLNAPQREERPLQAFRDGPLRAVYQGRLGPGRHLDDLLAAAEADGVELSLRIPLVDPRALRESVAARGLTERVRVLDPVPPEGVLDALAEFEVGLLFDRPQSRNSELSLPNKLFEYLMAGLAVVAPRLESLGPLFEEERVGLTFEPGRPDELARALERLAGDRELLAEFRRRARTLALTRLNAEAGADTLVAAWEGTA
jgi:glycogen(starch) synthase